MRELSPEDLARLMRSSRNLMISLVAVVVLLVAGLVILIRTDTDFPVGVLGPLLGIGIGTLMLVPQRALLRELGLTPPEARAIVEAEKARRRPADLRSSLVRARRERIIAIVWTGAGLAWVVILIIAAQYFFSKAGQTVEEDAPTDPWFAISFFAGVVALVMVPVAFVAARQRYQSSVQWQSASSSEARVDDSDLKD